MAGALRWRLRRDAIISLRTRRSSSTTTAALELHDQSPNATRFPFLLGLTILAEKIAAVRVLAQPETPADGAGQQVLAQISDEPS